MGDQALAYRGDACAPPHTSARVVVRLARGDVRAAFLSRLASLTAVGVWAVVNLIVSLF